MQTALLQRETSHQPRYLFVRRTRQGRFSRQVQPEAHAVRTRANQTRGRAIRSSAQRPQKLSQKSQPNFPKQNNKNRKKKQKKLRKLKNKRQKSQPATAWCSQAISKPPSVTPRHISPA
ncbi:Hypothetical_protein [Hexamita inflata]|uniref:Hypothetical_protein n=1 Tax=Hexamita inflata TaxID=28002 RepID=A0ABP1IKY7_9EUKA